MTRGATLGLFALAFSACLNEPKPSEGVSARLTGGTVAQVGSTNIAASEVSLVATARNLDLLEARRSAVRDALFAQGAVADVGIDSSEVETRVLARAMLEALSRDARLRPIDEAEFDDWRLARFIDVDRPEGFRVVHAVVLVDASAPEAKQKAARTHAEGLRLKLEPLVASAATKSPPVRQGRDVFMERLGLPEDPVAAAFREAADAWKHEEFDTRYEPLGLITADGRYIDYARSPWDRLLPEFASAAARLERRGELSPVVETEMELQDGKHLRGFHVIVLLERTPPLKLDEQEWRAALTPEIHQARALRAQKELMDSLRGAARIAIERNVDAHLAALPAPSK